MPGASGGSVAVLLSDGTQLPTTMLPTDPTRPDQRLAVVEVAQADGLVAATVADSDALRVGQSVLWWARRSGCRTA